MMNRSFRAEAHAGPAARSLGAVIKEKDEELALFLEMRKREKERNDSMLLLHTAEDLDPPPGSKPGSSPIFKIVPALPTRRSRHDDFLNSDNDKNDYDWLLTPPGTPLFPSLEKEPNRSPTGINGTPKTRQAILRSRLANPHEPSIRGNSVSRPTATSSITNSVGVRRPSSSGGRGSVSSRISGGSSVTSKSGPGSVASRPTSSSSRPATGPSSMTSRPTSSSSRPATPTGRSTISALPKGSRPSTPTSRTPTVPAASKTSLPAKTVASRSSTPSRSATPTSRASLAPPSKPSSRASTPTRRPSTPSTIPNNSGPLARSSSVTRSTPVAKPASMTAKAPTPARSSSPSVKPRPWKPLEMPGFSLDAPPNLRTSLPERPSSAARGRPGVPSSRSSSVEPGPAIRPRRQSCSPSRGRDPNSCGYSGSSVPATSRIHANGNGNDNVSPVAMGNKMVERVVNSRRLAPPKQESITSTSSNSAGKSSLSPDSSGFGRNLSKKSLDMAVRHMDIRRSIPNSLRPLMTKIPASSVYSVRSGPRSSRAVSASDSPLATSSNASSELSVSNNNLCFAGSEIGDDDASTR